MSSVLVKYVDNQQLSMEELKAIAEFLASRSLTITCNDDTGRIEVLDTETDYEIASWEDIPAGAAWFSVNDKTVLVGISEDQRLKKLMLNIPFMNDGVIDPEGVGPSGTVIVDSDKHEFVFISEFDFDQKDEEAE